MLQFNFMSNEGAAKKPNKTTCQCRRIKTGLRLRTVLYTKGLLLLFRLFVYSFILPFYNCNKSVEIK